MGLIKQNQAVIWIQTNGPGTQLGVFAADSKNAAMSGKSIPVATISPTYERNRLGRATPLNVSRSAPGDLPGATITIYEQNSLTFLDTLVKSQCPINIQLRYVDCGVLDNPNIWDKVQIWSEGSLTTNNPGDGPSLGFNDESMTSAGSFSFRRVLIIVRTGLSNFNPPAAGVLNILAIDGISDEDCNECGVGYPGADKVLVAGMEAGVAATAKVIATSTGGSSLGNVAADPFIADEDVSSVQVYQIDSDTYRVIVGTNTTAAGNKAHIAYADFNWGDELNPIGAAWTPTIVTSSVNADIVEAIGWFSYARVYIAASGDIYVSETQGEFADDAAIYTGATTINGFATTPDGTFVFAFGNTNLILRERDGNGTFEGRVGPTGGGAFHSLAISENGTIFAGNGQSIYKSTDNAGNANNWTELKDFGTNNRVVGIDTVSGDSEVLRVVVDDTTPGTGQVWESLDGGASFRQITALANTGYNDAYFSETNDNLAVIVGDGNIVQFLSPTN